MAGALAQLVERLVRNEKVRGSTPLSSTTGIDKLPVIALSVLFLMLQFCIIRFRFIIKEDNGV